jgi:TRAP transporter 4TM/12TM fusion protein
MLSRAPANNGNSCSAFSKKMSNPTSTGTRPQQQLSEQFEDVLREAETGARRDPTGLVGKGIFYTCLLWAVYQLYEASPLPFHFHFLLLNETQQRPIHLAFAMFVVFCTFPALRSSSRTRVPWSDFLLGAIGIATCLYLVVFYDDISARAGGRHPDLEIAVAIVGMLCVAEATRRALSIWLVVIVALFVLYAFGGQSMPGIISHRGTSLNALVDHLWLTTEGIFGISLGVSNSLIFVYVIFGALLEKAGASAYFVQLAFALLGHLRGGPAKASVLASALTGMVSGSAIADVVMVGTFTVPMMKRVGYTPEKAGAIQTSAAINAQIMPPVMGAAAFLMAEFVGIPYFQVVKHAFLPAIMAYVGLYYIVHVEAIKLNIPQLRKRTRLAFARKLLNSFLALAGLIVGAGATYYLIEAIKGVFGSAALFTVIVLYAVAHVLLVRVAARYPQRTTQAGGDQLEVPEALPTLLGGLYYLLPVVVLLWCLAVERFSAERSVLWAIIATVFMVLTRRPLLAYFTGNGETVSTFIDGIRDLINGLAGGARTVAAIAVALAAAGFIVGIVSLTGIGLVMTSVISTISGGNFTIALVLTAVLCVVLGMGLPTTANYIVVIAVMAEPLVVLASHAGIDLPLIAVHLFVFYFGLLSGTTPPVSVDSFAGAAVAQSDPLKTAVQAFFYDIRTSILPFVFIFNSEIILIGVHSIWHLALVTAVSVLAIIVFVAATQRYFLVRNKIWETPLLIVVAIALLRPSIFLDPIYAPFNEVPVTDVAAVVEKQPADDGIRLFVHGQDFSGQTVDRIAFLPLGPSGQSGIDRLWNNAGIMLSKTGPKVTIDNVRLNSPAQKAGLDSGWSVDRVEAPAQRPAKDWIYIPALALLGIVVLLQLRRRGRERRAMASSEAAVLVPTRQDKRASETAAFTRGTRRARTRGPVRVPK